MDGDLKEYGNVKGVRGCKGGAGIASPLQACDQAVQMFGGENAGAEAAGAEAAGPHLHACDEAMLLFDGEAASAEAAGAEAAGGEAASGYPMSAGFSGGMQ